MEEVKEIRALTSSIRDLEVKKALALQRLDEAGAQPFFGPTLKKVKKSEPEPQRQSNLYKWIKPNPNPIPPSGNEGSSLASTNISHIQPRNNMRIECIYSLATKREVNKYLL